MNEARKILVEKLNEKFGDSAISRTEIDDVAISLGQNKPQWLYKQKELRVARGMYKINALVTPIGKAHRSAPYKPESKQDMKHTMIMESSYDKKLIPELDPMYVPFGDSKMIRNVIKSGVFFPVFITGMSGNGKTFGVEQECAKAKREMIRVNFTVETDEDDLIGGFRLVNGETKFFDGPVVEAMERGALLLLDELDLADPAKVMCLQSILEGSSYHIKKTGRLVRPADGFNVIATGNTKGKGSDDGRFIGTQIMNEAFLERFPITVEQEYPSVVIEKKILRKVFDDLNIDDYEFIEKLTDWADIIRKTFDDGGVDEIISTRRLVHISKAYAIWNDRMQAIGMCTKRFDDDTKESFLDLYTKVDGGVSQETDEVGETVDPPF